MKTFKQFINESIRGKMTGISDDKLKDELDKLDIGKRLSKINELGLDDSYLPFKKDIKEYLSSLSVSEWTRMVKKYDFLDDSYLPTSRQIKKTLFDERNIKDFEKKLYKKVKLLVDGHIIKLKSYNTIVAEYNHRTKKLKPNGWYSRTTARHINEFISYLCGDKSLSKKELEDKKPIKI